MIEIVDPGPLATIQDRGRPGHAALGVGASGAADPVALALANRLVGNAEGAAGIEVTLGGLVVHFTVTTLFALTGAPCPARVGARPVGMYAPTYALAGEELRVSSPLAGLRSYLAVGGGIDVPPVLGSRATDVLAGLGPAPLAPGQRLPLGPATGTAPLVDLAPQPGLPAEPFLRVLPGPRDDWFAPAALEALSSAPYVVSPRSNRVGLRLQGPALERRRPGELPPEAMVPGALQVPPDGQPVLFLVDHPVTGGYPVIGVVHEDDLRFAAQAAPGQQVRFRLGVRGA